MSRITFAIALLLLASPPVAALVWYAPLSLHQQFDRADHAVHARVVQIERPGDFDRQASPMGDCGVHYRIEVLEQFKGELPTTAWFVTHKLLYPEMPLSVGEEIVILARDLTRLRADDPFRDDLESIRSTLQECRANVPSLYVAYFEDNVFPLLRKVGTDGPSLWLEHSGQTKPAAGLEARGTGRCRPQSDGSCRHNPAVAWPEVQRAFKEWARK